MCEGSCGSTWLTPQIAELSYLPCWHSVVRQSGSSVIGVLQFSTVPSIESHHPWTLMLLSTSSCLVSRHGKG